MDKRESGEILEHMILEEIKLEDISYIEPPEEWNAEMHQKEPHSPPVLIQETGEEHAGRLYTLLAHHRSFWKVRDRGQNNIRAIIVRSSVHIPLAHESISNCVEEALLFDGLLRNGLCENRSRLSELLGYSRARITQILNLLKLPKEIRRKLLLTDEISEFQLRPIVRVSDPADQNEMFMHLLRGKLTGRQMALFADVKENDQKEEKLEDIQELLDSMESEPEDDEAAEQEVEETEVPASESETGSRSAVVGQEHARELVSLLTLRDSNWRKEAENRGLEGIDKLFLTGVHQLRNGLYRECNRTMDEVIQRNPEYAPAYFYLGKCQNLTGELDSAEGTLRRAIELVPEEPDYLVELAIVLEKLKRESEASTLYRRAGAIRRKASESEAGD